MPEAAAVDDKETFADWRTLCQGTPPVHLLTTEYDVVGSDEIRDIVNSLTELQDLPPGWTHLLDQAEVVDRKIGRAYAVEITYRDGLGLAGCFPEGSEDIAFTTLRTIMRDSSNHALYFVGYEDNMAYVLSLRKFTMMYLSPSVSDPRGRFGARVVIVSDPGAHPQFVWSGPVV